jgi:hypothetical protein
VKLLLVVVGLLVSAAMVARGLHTGRARLLPVSVLGFGLLMLAVLPHRWTNRVGFGLLTMMQLLLWVLAPLLSVGAVCWGVARLARIEAVATWSRLGLVTLALSLGVAGGLVLHGTPWMPAVGRELAGAVSGIGRELWQAVLHLVPVLPDRPPA